MADENEHQDRDNIDLLNFSLRLNDYSYYYSYRTIRYSPKIIEFYYIRQHSIRVTNRKIDGTIKHSQNNEFVFQTTMKWGSIML